MRCGKTMTALLLAGLVGSSVFMSTDTAWAAAGWKQEGSQWKYIDTDGSEHKGWAKSTDGTYYYMDLSTGYMVTGWKQINNNWYYFRSNGAMATKWVEDGGKYYYLMDDTGVLVKGWLRIGDDYYYMKGDGAMSTGWREMDGGWFYFKENGKCTLGWGQMEAARSLGLSYGKAMRKVILPQAFRTMLPSIINQFIISLKDTSLVSVIGPRELTQNGKIIAANSASMVMPIWICVALFYLVVCTILSRIAKYVERRVSYGK